VVVPLVLTAVCVSIWNNSGVGFLVNVSSTLGQSLDAVPENTVVIADMPVEA
jgi:hypothetical protein